MLPGMPAMVTVRVGDPFGKTVPPFGRVGTLGTDTLGSFGSRPVMVPGTTICGSFGRPTLGTFGSGTSVFTTNGVGTAGSLGSLLIAASLMAAVSELPLDSS